MVAPKPPARGYDDASKMERYNELLGSPAERFFVSGEEAAAWLGTAH